MLLQFVCLFFLLGPEDMLTRWALCVLLKHRVGEFYVLPLVSLYGPHSTQHKPKATDDLRPTVEDCVLMQLVVFA